MSKKRREKNILSRIQRTLAKKTHGTRQSPPPTSPVMGGALFGSGGKPPKGFRSLSMTQAMMEFTNPIMEYVNTGTISDPNDALQLGMHLWNFTLPRTPVQMKKSRKDLIKGIAKTLHMKSAEATQFFDRMIERKAYLFPDDIQPEGTMMMCMRKDAEYQIVTFDERQLHLSQKSVPDTEHDRKLRDALLQMDHYLEERAEYDVWESHFVSMNELCRQCYGHWLEAKGASETYSSAFALCTDVYLTFLYQYDGCGLRDVSKGALNEFFMDFILRKALVKPPEGMTLIFCMPLFRLSHVFASVNP